jgi:hypothetical protein
MPTTMATTILLPIPVGFTLLWMDMQAFVTGLTRISRVNQYQLDSRNSGFIGCELAQLVERPTMVLSMLRFTNFGVLPNARQILKRNGRISSLRFVDQLTADGVIDVCLESAFSPREPFKELFCPSDAFGLNARPNMHKVVANFLNLLSRPRQSCTGVSDILATHIDPKHFGRFVRRLSWNINLNLNVVIPIPALALHCTGGRLPFQQSKLIISNRQRQLNPSVQEGDTHKLFRFILGERSHVQRHRSGPKFVNLLLSGHGSNHPPNGLADMVCLQTRLCSDIVVGCIVQLGCVAYFLVFRYLQYLIASIRKCLQSAVNFLTQLYRHLKLAGYRYCLAHRQSMSHPGNGWETAV